MFVSQSASDTEKLSNEIVTKSCDESVARKFSNKSSEVTKSIRAKFYDDLFYDCPNSMIIPMLLIMSNSVRRSEFMANYKYRRKSTV